MGFIQNNKELIDGLSLTSPKIKRFLNGLNNGTASGIDFSMLDKFKQSDGSIFRIVESVRSFATQADYYKKGRVVDYQITESNIFNAPEGKRGKNWKVKSENVVDSSAIVTHAQAGQSFHNYGLAVDLVFRSIGYSESIDWKGKHYNSLKDFYRECGLVSWAKICGLEWGGDWSWSDTVHFEDPGYSIPSLDSGLMWSENASFDFIKKYNDGYFTGSSGSLNNPDLVKYGIIAGGVAVISTAAYFIFKRIKRGF